MEGGREGYILPSPSIMKLSPKQEKDFSLSSPPLPLSKKGVEYSMRFGIVMPSNQGRPMKIQVAELQMSKYPSGRATNDQVACK